MTQFHRCAAALLMPMLISCSLNAAEKIVATVSGSDFQVGATVDTVQEIAFAASEPITGVGFTGLWSLVVGDTVGGKGPWSLDLGIAIDDPAETEQVFWSPVGGDITIASFPLQDFQTGFSGVEGTGTFTWTFSNEFGSALPSWIMGLSNVQYHLTTEVPDVIDIRSGTTSGGELWNRPFFIDGVSQLGPVMYKVLAFRVEVGGGYVLQSVSTNGSNNGAYFYQGGFDPQAPLANLLDYDNGNGFSQTGTPQGTSRIEALLLEDVTYYYVNSQWSATSAPQSYNNTITGPGALLPPPNPCPGNANADQLVDVFDLLDVLDSFGACADPCPPKCNADVNSDCAVDVFDLLDVLDNWGPCN